MERERSIILVLQDVPVSHFARAYLKGKQQRSERVVGNWAREGQGQREDV